MEDEYDESHECKSGKVWAEVAPTRTYKRTCLGPKCGKKFLTNSPYERMCYRCQLYVGAASDERWSYEFE